MALLTEPSFAARVRVTAQQNLRDASSTQKLHYVLTTDCTAMMLSTGHIHATLLDMVQPGHRFSWLVWGCTLEEQRPMFEKVVHADARVRFFRERYLRDPDTDMPMPDFQASSRPMMVRDWVTHFPGDIAEDEVVVLVEPDQFMIAPMEFRNQPLNLDRLDISPTLSNATRRAFERDAVIPGRAAAQDADVGARWYHLEADELEGACKPWGGRKTGNCTALTEQEAGERYGSGPPWAMHSSDFRRHATLWEPLMIRLEKSSQKSFETEQSAYGWATAYMGLDSVLYKHYTVSNSDPSVHFEGWDRILDIGRYDPCEAREPPTSKSGLMPLFLHACQSYTAKDQNGTWYTMHKDNLPKDLLECNAPLLKHPQKDLLQKKVKLKGGARSKKFRDAWMVCTWTNLINSALTKWKGQNCKATAPNLERSFMVQDHFDGFRFSGNLNSTSWHLPSFFNKGGFFDEPVELQGTPLAFAYPEEASQDTVPGSESED